MAGGARAWFRDSPTDLARFDITVAMLQRIALRLRADAKVKARVGPDEGEGDEAQAATIDRVLLMLEGGPESLDAGAAGAYSDACSYPGCDKGGSFCFGLGSALAKRACGEHRIPVEEAFRAAEDERRRITAEALKPKTAMDGIGERLI